MPIESTPVSGVEIKNEVVAAGLAPLSRSAIAVGITEQEQSGNGTPIDEARKTDRKEFFPSSRYTCCSGIKARKHAAAAIPRNKYGADSAATHRRESRKRLAKCIRFSILKT